MFLGFWLDSKDMTVKPTAEKVEKIKGACEQLLSQEVVTIKELSQTIGIMVSNFPAVQYGQLFYRRCDHLKNNGLKESKGRYEAKVSLTDNVQQDLQWWIDHIEGESRKIVIEQPKLVIETDASNIGWGACIKGTKDSTGGNWTDSEATEHINYLELLAAWFGIQSYEKTLSDSHIQVLTDNTTAVAYINNQGGTKQKCNEVARKIWCWCYENKNWVSAAHLPGSLNVTADRESRTKHDNMEWKLDEQLFQKICEEVGKPEVDLFASRLNHQLEKHMSWKPDPQACAVDALSVSWKDIYFYAFPPFSMILKVLQKIQTDTGKGVVVVPYWPTQPWWPKFTSMCLEPTLILSRMGRRPRLTHPWREESELPKMKLVAGLLSGKSSGSLE